MDLLTYFALPIATILLAFAVEKVLRMPILTALTAFAIYLIVAFSSFDSSFLVFVIVYTVLAYIAAWFAEYLYTNCIFGHMSCSCGCNNSENTDDLRLKEEAAEEIAQRVVNILSSMNNCRRR